MKTKINAALVAISVVSMAASASAQVQFTQDGRPEKIVYFVSGLNSEDKRFMNDAAIMDIYEIQLGRLAQAKSSNPFVIEYGKEMQNGHTMALEELKQVATPRGIELPIDLPDAMKQKLAHFENLNGDAFDQAFNEDQTNGHAAASGVFKSQISWGHDQEVTYYAMRNLPEVLLHYRMMLLKQTQMGPTKMMHGE